MPSFSAIRHHGFTFVCAAMLLTLGACSSPQASKKPPSLGDPIDAAQHDSANPPKTNTDTGNTNVSAALTVDDVAKLFPLKPRQGVYRITQGADKGKDVPFTLEKVDDDQWKLTYKDQQVTYFKTSDKGLLITREDDFGENVQVTYEPAINCLPVGLSKDKPFEGKTQMTVRKPSGETRDSGTCQYTVTFEGVQRVKTPAGASEARIIRNVRKLDLSLANVTVDIFSAYAVPQGEVIERVEQKTQALGFIGMNKLTERRLVEASE